MLEHAGVHKPKRPSGAQQRKARRTKLKAIQEQAGAMLQYVGRGLNTVHTEGTSKESVPAPGLADDSSDGVMQYVAEEHELQITEGSEAVGEAAEIDSTGDSDNTGGDAQERGSETLRDVSYWQIPLTDSCRIEITKKGSASFQNKDGPFSAASRPGLKTKGEFRRLSSDWFYKVMPNGHRILRSWMVYSPVSEQLYCFCCRLFAIHATDTSSRFVTGFQTWWKLNPKVEDYERSEEYLRCLEQWRTLETRLMLHKTIDAACMKSVETEKKKWRDILHRLLDITLFLSKQNLAFRGHREDELSPNRGNFLEMVELLLKYDPVLKEHVMMLNQSTGRVKVSVSYLSPATQNEFIGALARHVKEKLVTEIKSAQYYGIMFDSTPDISL